MYTVQGKYVDFKITAEVQMNLGKLYQSLRNTTQSQMLKQRVLQPSSVWQWNPTGISNVFNSLLQKKYTTHRTF